MPLRVSTRRFQSARPGRWGLAYDRVGHGEPLVLLHPLGADRRVWRPVLDLLSADHDVIAVDLPGFGESPPLVEPTPARLAQAVAGLIAELGFERVQVAGISLGGWVALELALAGHASTVTAIAPAGLWREPLGPKPLVGWWVARLLRPAVGVLVRSRRLRTAALSGSVAHPERVSPVAAAALIRGYGGPGYPAVNAEMRARVFTGLADITVPVRLAWPSRDTLVSRPRSLPAGIEEVVLEDCGHVPIWDDPAAVAAAIRR